MKHEISFVELAHFVGTLNNQKMGVSGYVRKQDMPFLQSSVLDEETTKYILSKIEHFEFPKFNGTRILFNFNAMIEVSEKVENVGCYCAFDVVEYQRWYKPDCADCITGLKNIRDKLSSFAKETHTIPFEYAFDKFCKEIQGDLMMASIKVFVVRLATGIILKYHM